MEVTNSMRAKSAGVAVAAHSKKTGLLKEDMYIQVKDLMTNLCHFCKAQDIDITDVQNAAYGMYEQEVEEDAP